MTAVPTTRTWVAGEVVTAAFMNNTIRDVDNFLLARPQCLVNMASAQSLTTGTWIALNFDTETVDTTGMHSTSSNTDRLTAVYPGWYQLSGAYAPTSNAVGARGARYSTALAATPTTEVILDASQLLFPTVALGIFPARTMPAFLNVGDVAREQAFQSSGGNLGVSNTANERSGFYALWTSN
jgi:hypothetical protein